MMEESRIGTERHKDINRITELVKKNDSTRPTCLELFAGCGGLSYGFHKFGFNIVCANELDPEIAKTY